MHRVLRPKQLEDIRLSNELREPILPVLPGPELVYVTYVLVTKRCKCPFKMLDYCDVLPRV